MTRRTPAGARGGLLALTSRWFWVVGLLGLCGCSTPFHPLLAPQVEEALHEAQPLPIEKVIRGTPQTPDEGPAEPFEESLERVKRNVADVPPPDSLPLTLAEVRRDTLAGNLDLQVELFNPSIAEAGASAERARFEAVFTPRIRGTETWDENDLWSTQGTLQPGFRVPMRTGGVATFELPMTRSELEDVDIRQYDASLDLSISQPLLRNAGLETNEAPIRVAELRWRRADALTKLAAIRILAEAERAYWWMYASHAELQVALQQYEWAEEQLRMATRLVEEGVRSRVEVYRAETGVAQRVEGIIVGETNRRRLERDLKRIMQRDDLPMLGPTVLIPRTTPSPLGLDLDPEKLMELAGEHRMELLVSEVDLAIDQSSLTVARNQVLPRLDLDFTYSMTGQRPHLDRALAQMFDRELDVVSGGLSAEIPLGNVAARSRLRGAILQEARTMAGQRQLELAIRQEVQDAVDAVHQNWLRILSAREETRRATRTYRGEQRQFGAGVVTSTEVLQAATAVAAAQVREIQALRDYQTSLVDLSFATGTVLGRGKVTWAPRRIEDLGGAKD